MLRERGFRKRRNRFHRYVDGAWQVVDFQASQFGSRDDVRFTINVWVGVPELATGDAGADNQLGERIGAVMHVGDHWWSVDDGTNVATLAGELRAVLADHALPWLEARGSLEQIVTLARAEPDGFPKQLIGRFAMLLERSGLTELAAEFSGRKQ